ncbi:MAG: hypothetical protein ABIG39_01310 [Candidatus Micrarchaeota archaeon]
MITGGKIFSVEAKRKNDEPITGLSINIGIDDVTSEGNDLQVKYTYTAEYAKDVGTLTISGAIMAQEEHAREVVVSWKKDKKLPEDFAELILNTINFTCGTNGTLVVRPLNLSPPMVPPRIELAKATDGPTSGTAGAPPPTQAE